MKDIHDSKVKRKKSVQVQKWFTTLNKHRVDDSGWVKLNPNLEKYFEVNRMRKIKKTHEGFKLFQEALKGEINKSLHIIKHHNYLGEPLPDCMQDHSDDDLLVDKNTKLSNLQKI